MQRVLRTCIHVLVTQHKPAVVLLRTLLTDLQVWADVPVSLEKLPMTNLAKSLVTTWTKLAWVFTQEQTVLPNLRVAASLR